MNMKNFRFAVFVIFICLLSACKVGKWEPVELSVSDMRVGGEAQSHLIQSNQSFSFESVTYTLNGEDHFEAIGGDGREYRTEWFSVTTIHGQDNESPFGFTIVIQANETGQERRLELTLQRGNASGKFTLTQLPE